MRDAIIGWRVDANDRAALLRRFPPRYANTVADHVTFGRGNHLTLPDIAVAEVVGRADDGAGVEALVATLDAAPTDRPAGPITSPGRSPTGAGRRRATTSSRAMAGSRSARPRRCGSSRRAGPDGPADAVARAALGSPRAAGTPPPRRHSSGMMTAGKVALATVCGGLLGGALLGQAANPVMKAPAEQWWQLTGRPEPTEAPAIAWTEPAAGDLALPGGYRPDLDYDAFVTADWLPPPSWSWSGDDDALAREADWADAYPVAPLPDEATVEAAVEAEQAAEDARLADGGSAAETASPEPQRAGSGLPGIW